MGLRQRIHEPLVDNEEGGQKMRREALDMYEAADVSASFAVVGATKAPFDQRNSNSATGLGNNSAISRSYKSSSEIKTSEHATSSQPTPPVPKETTIIEKL